MRDPWTPCAQMIGKLAMHIGLPGKHSVSCETPPALQPRGDNRRLRGLAVGVPVDASGETLAGFVAALLGKLQRHRGIGGQARYVSTFGECEALDGRVATRIVAGPTVSAAAGYSSAPFDRENIELEVRRQSHDG